MSAKARKEQFQNWVGGLSPRTREALAGEPAKEPPRPLDAHIAPSALAAMARRATPKDDEGEEIPAVKVDATKAAHHVLVFPDGGATYCKSFAGDIRELARFLGSLAGKDCYVYVFYGQVLKYSTGDEEGRGRFLRLADNRTVMNLPEGKHVPCQVTPLDQLGEFEWQTDYYMGPTYMSSAVLLADPDEAFIKDDGIGFSASSPSQSSGDESDGDEEFYGPGMPG